MKILLIYMGLTAITVQASLVSNDHLNKWQMFKARHGKTYNNEGEEEFRMQVYLNNSRYVKEHNELYARGEVSYTLRMNKFGDLLPHEFERMMFKNSRSKRYTYDELPCTKIRLNETTNLSDKWDWRDRGAVSPVKNQRVTSCGACWAFSAVAALESHHYLRTKRMVILSEQNLLDCASEPGDDGCDGGFADEALTYVARNGGIESEKYYPYIGKMGKCKYDPKYSADQISDCGKLPAADEQQLKIAVEKIGPVTVAMYGDRSLMLFDKGIYESQYCTAHPEADLNHELLAVGFGTSQGKDYWLLKNSWGTNWAEGGFFKIVRNQNNHCGVAEDSNFPIAKEQ